MHRRMEVCVRMIKEMEDEVHRRTEVCEDDKGDAE